MSARSDPPPYVVRRAGNGEAAAVANVWLRSRKASAPAIPPSVHGNDDVRNWFATVVLPTREVWVVDARELVAVMVLEDDWIDQLYVDPAWTGRKVGSTLLDTAKALRANGLDLWTFQSNTGARRFYERHGFTPVETTSGDNEEGAPDIHYHWPAPAPSVSESGQRSR